MRAAALTRLWYRRRLAPALWPLLPLGALFAALVAARRALYRLGWLSSQRLPVPVLVVGNLTVGGSGKTPLVLWLVDALRAAGRAPGIVSRGYGGSAAGQGEVCAVSAESDPRRVGDEPLLLARRSGVPVYVGRDRVAAARALLAAHPRCDLIISDDGLQHYRLQRDVEVAVFDARGAGNARLLPVGPLREPLARLRAADALVCNGVAPATLALPHPARQFAMRLCGERFYALGDARRECTAPELRGRRLHALAGIGDPARFFAQLAALGLDCEPHPFADHQRYSAEDLAFADDGVLLMTEKDAVKCAGLTVREAWVLPVEAQLEAAEDGTTLLDTLLEKLDGCTSA